MNDQQFEAYCDAIYKNGKRDGLKLALEMFDVYKITTFREELEKKIKNLEK